MIKRSRGTTHSQCNVNHLTIFTMYIRDIDSNGETILPRAIFFSTRAVV